MNHTVFFYPNGMPFLHVEIKVLHNNIIIIIDIHNKFNLSAAKHYLYLSEGCILYN